MDDTINMFSEASHFFLSKAKETKGTEQENYYTIAAVTYSWILLEAYVNQAAESLAVGRRLKDHEKCFLLEKEFFLTEDGTIKECRAYPPTLKKSLLLINLFSKKEPKKVKQMTLWNEVKQCVDLRDKIIHPKQNTELNVSTKTAERFREITLKYIKFLNTAIFRKRINIF